MNLLLDTCAFLWLAGDPSQLSAPAVAALNDSTNQLLLSDASVWEIVLKNAAGKLPLPAPPRIWIPKQRTFFQLKRQAIDPEALFLSGELPDFHRDPFDRLLAAQAIAHRLTLVTPDLPLRRLGAETCW
jgi:PIN domain nuclease of toxin-antitoxin system